MSPGCRWTASARQAPGATLLANADAGGGGRRNRGGPMSGLLYRMGRAAAARPWRVIGGWLAVLAIALTLSMTLGGQPRDDYRVAGSPAQAGSDFLDANFEGAYGADA